MTPLAQSCRRILQLSLTLGVAGTASFAWALEPVAPARPMPPPPPSQADLSTAAANGQFAVDLFQQLTKEQADKNLFVSPFSISIALTMAAEGAAGDTAEQMTKALHLPAGPLAEVHRSQASLQKRVTPLDLPAAVAQHLAQLRASLKAANEKTSALQSAGKIKEAQDSAQQGQKLANELNAILKDAEPYELRIANALWADKTYPFRPAYLNVLQPTYGAVLFPVDFKSNFEQVRGKINGWVEDHTNQRIKDLIGRGALDEYTRLVITNAVFFKGEWETPFEVDATKESPFLTGSGEKPKLPMMHLFNHKTASYAAFHGDGAPFKTPREIPVDMKDTDPSLYPDENGFLALSLTYKGQKLAMTVLVPQSNKGLNRLEQLLSYEQLQAWQKQLERRTVEVTLPKFKLDADYKLVKTLQALGIRRAFIDPRDAQGAQFDKMSDSQDPDQKLYIANVLHKTFVDVNEKGTEAAAATAVIFATPASDRGGFEFPKTRPFIPHFQADKPFLFLIRDTDTGSILFLGRYVGPA